MAKRAFCVGINDYPDDGSDLNGCVNDANAWAGLLKDHYDFSDVTVITDSEATKKNVVDGLKALLGGVGKGDILVFTNSSHGTYVVEKGGDEPKYDEALCPYDVKGELLLDDEIRELVGNLSKGANLTIISDSCFSGTVTRAAISENLPGLRTPDDRRVRFYSPALRGDPVLHNPWKALPKRFDLYPEEEMNHLLLTGCNDKEYSYDALIGGTYHGAMTYHAILAIQQSNYSLTYAQLHARTTFLVDEAQYNQHPQLEGPRRLKRRQIFT